VVAVVVWIETGSYAAFGAVTSRDSLGSADTGSAADLVVAVVVWIKIGSRACSDTRGRSNTCGCPNAGGCASPSNRGKSARCQPGSKRFSRDSRCGRSIRRAYSGSVCRDAGARAGSFSTNDESSSDARAGYSDHEAGGKGAGYSALAHDPLFQSCPPESFQTHQLKNAIGKKRSFTRAAPRGLLVSIDLVAARLGLVSSRSALLPASFIAEFSHDCRLCSIPCQRALGEHA
jgi:hypothetical protein